MVGDSTTISADGRSRDNEEARASAADVCPPPTGAVRMRMRKVFDERSRTSEILMRR